MDDSLSSVGQRVIRASFVDWFSAALMHFRRHHPPSTAPGHDDNRNLIGSDALAPPAMLEALDAKCTSVPPSDVPDFAPTSGNEIKPTLWAELCTTLKNRLFLLITFGYAGWIGVVLGLSSFGPAFTQVSSWNRTPNPMSRPFTLLQRALGCFLGKVKHPLRSELALHSRVSLVHLSEAGCWTSR